MTFGVRSLSNYLCLNNGNFRDESIARSIGFNCLDESTQSINFSVMNRRLSKFNEPLAAVVVRVHWQQFRSPASLRIEPLIVTD
jgi:hypothetical protein